MPITVPELSTDRLLLRAYRTADIPDMVEHLGIWETVQYTTNIPHPYRKEDAEKYVAANKYLSDSGLGVFAIERRADYRWIGAISLEQRNIRSNLRPELGYVLGKAFWGQGYAKEAAKRILSYGFDQLGLDDIMATTYLENIPSERVLLSLGFHHRQNIKLNIPQRGGVRELKEFRLNAERWREQAHG